MACNPIRPPLPTCINGSQLYLINAIADVKVFYVEGELLAQVLMKCLLNEEEIEWGFCAFSRLFARSSSKHIKFTHFWWDNFLDNFIMLITLLSLKISQTHPQKHLLTVACHVPGAENSPLPHVTGGVAWARGRRQWVGGGAARDSLPQQLAGDWQRRRLAGLFRISWERFNPNQSAPFDAYFHF